MFAGLKTMELEMLQIDFINNVPMLEIGHVLVPNRKLQVILILEQKSTRQWTFVGR